MILKRIGRVSSAAYKCKTIDVDWRIKSVFEGGYFKGLFLQTPQEYPPIKGVFEQYAEVIAERFSLRGKIVLDVGTATGSLPYFMDKFGVEAVGMDISLWASKRRVCKLWIRGDCESLPFRDSSFDCVTAIDVIEHLPSPERFIAEAYRVLKNGGILLVRTPEMHSQEAYGDTTHISLRPLNEWERILSKTGFKLEQQQLWIIQPPKGGKLRYLPFKKALNMLFRKKVVIANLAARKIKESSP